jgi:hypothetical protein
MQSTNMAPALPMVPDARNAHGIVTVALVDLHLQSRLRMPGIDADDGEPHPYLLRASSRYALMPRSPLRRATSRYRATSTRLDSPTRGANEAVATTRQGHGLVDPNGTDRALARTRPWCWCSRLPPCPIMPACARPLDPVTPVRNEAPAEGYLAGPMIPSDHQRLGSERRPHFPSVPNIA